MGKLLAEPPYFPIFRSTDLGIEFSRMTGQINDWGLRYQPFYTNSLRPLSSFQALCSWLETLFPQIYLKLKLNPLRKTWKFISYCSRWPCHSKQCGNIGLGTFHCDGKAKLLSITLIGVTRHMAKTCSPDLQQPSHVGRPSG